MILKIVYFSNPDYNPFTFRKNLYFQQLALHRLLFWFLDPHILALIFSFPAPNPGSPGLCFGGICLGQLSTPCRVHKLLVTSSSADSPSDSVLCFVLQSSLTRLLPHPDSRFKIQDSRFKIQDSISRNLSLFRSFVFYTHMLSLQPSCVDFHLCSCFRLFSRSEKYIVAFHHTKRLSISVYFSVKRRNNCDILR